MNLEHVLKKLKMTGKDRELMVRILYALNCSKKIAHSDLVASLKCDPDRLESCLEFLREKMFAFPKVIPGTLKITYEISKRGIDILNMIDIWFKAKL